MEKDYLPVVYDVCAKVAGRSKTARIHPQELFSAGWFGLHAARRDYRDDMGVSFVTYAYHKIHGYARKEAQRMRSEDKHRPASFTDARVQDAVHDFRYVTDPGYGAVDDRDMVDALFRASRVTQSQRDVVVAIANGDTKLSIARRRGTSKTAVKAVAKRALSKLRAAAGGLK